MKQLALLFPLLFLFSCGNTPPEGQLALLNGINYRIAAGEQLSELTEGNRKTFVSHFQKLPPNLPLFKHIKGKNYSVYIGLPVNASIARLLNHRLAGTDSSQVQSLSDSSTYIYRRHIKDSIYMAEYIFSGNQSMIYLLCTTPSKACADTLLNLEAIASKIITDKP